MEKKNRGVDVGVRGIVERRIGKRGGRGNRGQDDDDDNGNSNSNIK